VRPVNAPRACLGDDNGGIIAMNWTERFGTALLLSASFGTGLAAIRVGVGYFPPITFTVLRLIVAAVAFLALLAVTHRRVRRESRFLVNVALLGMLGIGVPFITAAFAMRLISSTLVAILLNLIPVFSVVLAHFFLPDEPLTWQTVMGVTAAIFGASVVVWGSSGTVDVADNPQAMWLGLLLIVFNSLSVACANILARRLKDEDTLVVTGGQVLFGLTMVLPLALLIEGRPELHGLAWQGWMAVLWAGLIGCFLGYATSFFMISRFGVTFTSVASTATPLFTAVVGTVLLHEVVTPLMVVGALCLVGGVLTVNRALTDPQQF